MNGINKSSVAALLPVSQLHNTKNTCNYISKKLQMANKIDNYVACDKNWNNNKF